jgi:hypothetical protein
METMPMEEITIRVDPKAAQAYRAASDRSIGVIHLGTGNTLFNREDFEVYLPKQYTGTVYSLGLPGQDEVSHLGSGKE